MPRITNLALLKRAEQNILSIRRSCRYKDLPSSIGECYARLVSYIRELGEHPCEIISVAYHTYNFSEELDVDVFLPVPAPLPGRGDIRAAVQPSQLYAFSIYRGPYSEMPPIFDELDTFIAGQGFRRAGPHQECYYNGPEFLAREWLTRILIPIA